MYLRICQILAYVFLRGDRCFDYFRYAERTEINGVLKARNGREIIEVKIIFKSDDYFVYLFCPEIDGFCNPERVQHSLTNSLQVFTIYPYCPVNFGIMLEGEPLK